MNRHHHHRRSGGARDPMRPLASLGRRSTGWHSSLHTNPRESFGSFVVGLLIAAAAFVLIVLLVVWLGSSGAA